MSFVFSSSPATGELVNKSIRVKRTPPPRVLDLPCLWRPARRAEDEPAAVLSIPLRCEERPGRPICCNFHVWY
ncbi:unnamed protein product [Linum tenue]|uniref:Uncharacterized protein n=1 Tax=Linum tenue TaxID=586396 RepID=A0AAV0S5D9_9ROSI|nr:unnamed protein product [Linum tenue]